MAGRTLKIGVMGAGAVGCFVGGKLAGLGVDTVFVGRERLEREVGEHGLVLEDLGALTTTIAKGDVVFETDAACLADRDIVLCCVKSAGTAEAGKRLAEVLPPDAIVISFQNGVRNADELRKHVRQRVLAGIVNFNVLAKGDGVFRRATSGSLVIERCADQRPSELGAALERAGFEVEHVAPHKMRELQWAKLLLNLNNAIGALSDRPTKDVVLTAGYRRAFAATVLESLRVLRAAGIKPARLGTLPPWAIANVLRLPTPLVRMAARTQLKIDPQARSSMWQDLTNGRPTEVDWLNGEVVQLADACGARAPLNRRIVELVHEAERAGAGSPRLTPEDLWKRLND